jgi:competence protein CoiA
MLSAIRTRDDVQVVAADVERNEQPFRCPECGTDVILKKGRVRIHHFSHTPPVSCEYGQGESEEHRRAKTEIFEVLRARSDVEKCKLERSLGDVRPDVSARIRGVPVAIEVQISTLSLEQIVRRTIAYARLRIAILWITPFSGALYDERYSPKIWEKWMHAAYFGRVYYWASGDEVIPVHYDPYMLYREESSWYESGIEVGFGGYEYRSKRYRTPRMGQRVAIGTNFFLRERPRWTSNEYVVPAARLYMDQQAEWW